MRIIITTAIYPPEVGGPSFYARSLKEALEKAGHRADVVLFGRLKRVPSGVRHLLYALKVLLAAKGADAIIVLDTFSTAAPVGLIAPLLRSPVICRVGGDFVWEQYSERTREAIPLPRFYGHTEKWNSKERIAFRLIRFALGRMTVVFSSEWQAAIWSAPYSLDRRHIEVIGNSIPTRISGTIATRKNILFFGRPLFLKNAELFHRAFARAKAMRPELELDEGMVPREELQKRLASCYAVALPSVSDVTPNTILESIQYGKPFLLTEYSGYADAFKDLGEVVDPLSEDDLVRGILALADEATYDRLSKNIAAFTAVRTYGDIARDYLALISKIAASTATRRRRTR